MSYQINRSGQHKIRRALARGWYPGCGFGLKDFLAHSRRRKRVT